VRHQATWSTPRSLTNVRYGCLTGTGYIPEKEAPVSVKWTVTIDCAHPAMLAAFWNLALGYVDAPAPKGFASWHEYFAASGIPPEEWDDGAYIEDPGRVRPSISFLKVPEPKVVKNRVHLDVQVGGGRSQPWEMRWPLVTEAVNRLVAAGATIIHEDVWDGVPDHVIMADPEGNEFDVL
jgi:hypothetical protein